MSAAVVPARSALAAQRIQYRVGHGGFHATIVEDSAPKHHLVYVYDVGSKPDKRELLLAIKSFVRDLSTRGITQVDYVFLSHIDEDHVNGLRELLDALKNHKPTIAVANVVLPWLSSVQKLLTQSRNNHRQLGTVARNLAATDEEADNYLLRLGARNVIRVTAEGDDATPTATSTTSSGVIPKLPASFTGWLLLPIRTPTPVGFESSFRSELSKLLKKHGLNPNNPAHHEKILTDHRSAIKTALTKVASQLGVTRKKIANWSSLALLHGSSTPAQTCVAGSRHQHIVVQCAHGWLHTGDLPVSDAVVWGNLSSELGQASLTSPLCVVVAPHHGSGLDHQDALYDSLKPGTVILTTGTKLSGRNKGAPSYSYGLGGVRTKAGLIGATVVELNN